MLLNTCHYPMVPGENIFAHLGSRDEAPAFVEGYPHNFTPCRPEYCDTVKRAFDYVDNWLAKPERI